MTHGIELRALARAFEGRPALGPVDLAVEAGSILVVLGPSGCGKSTLLRLIGGLEQPSAGTVLVGGIPVVRPRDDVGVVFQEPRLMPWLTVEQNVGFGLAHLPRRERAPLVAAALQRVGLAGAGALLPKALSGGMAQRVSIARALVTRPAVLLMDEPFAALDPLARTRQQDHLIEILGRDRPTVLLVTHDVDEAVALADRVIVLDGPPGRVRLDAAIELPRPRRRTSAAFQGWKERLLEALGETPADREAALV